MLGHHWPLLPIVGSVLGFGLLGVAILCARARKWRGSTSARW